MINVTGSTLIERPLQPVFNFMSTPENDSQWQYGTLFTTRLSAGVGMLGASFRSFGHLMGRRVLSVLRVTEYEPARRYRVESLAGPLHTQTTYTFATLGGQTRLQISIRAVGVMAARGLERRMRKQLKENMILLKGLLEIKTLSGHNGSA